jgi:cold shock CspA family protein
MKLESNFFNHDAQAGGFFPNTHVGIDVSDFGKHQNTLIEGIRGTGKTHILKMIERYYLDKFPSLRVLPIYVSLAQISEHARKDVDEFRLHLYAHIVRRSIEALEKYSDFLQPDHSLLRRALEKLMRMFGLSMKPDLAEIIGMLKITADRLLFELQFNLTTENFRTAGTESFETAANVSSEVRGEVLPLKLALTGSMGEKTSLSETTEKTMMFMGSRLSHRDAASFIIEFLKQLQVILDLDYSLILLDECSEAAKRAQVEVFRLFKTIRGAGSQLPDRESCAFFIGSVYPRGETYYPTRQNDGFGFETGQDCTMEFLQWDEVDMETYISFFEEMTLSRAKVVLGYSGSFATLLRTIFDHEDAFYLAAYCANGIPRRYWEILKRAHDKHSNRILLKRVETAVQEIANNEILLHGYINEDDVEFINRLIDRLLQQNANFRSINRKSRTGGFKIPQNIYFSVERQQAQYLQRLIMQGAIHDKGRMRAKRMRFIQPMFSIDMAVTYTFRIIPQKSFVKMIRTDMPRHSSSGFDQAVEIPNSEIKNIYREHKRLADRLSSGTIKRWFPSKNYGFIQSNDGKVSFFFHAMYVQPDQQSKIAVGAKVKFETKEKKKGLQAINVKIL